jgi:uncharacterized protein YggE
MKSPLPWLVLASCLLSSCSINTAVPSGTAHIRKVTVVGNATIKVAPDPMLWNVQVSVNDTTLAAAKARHDASLTAALDYIKSLGDAVEDLQTGGIRFDKQTYFPPGDIHPTPFTCSTQFTFTLTDFDKYGAISDALAKLDGLQIQGVDYAYSKKDDVNRDALKQALVNAHDQAGDLAATADCSLGAPLEIVEGTDINPGPRPMMLKFAPAASAGTPAAVPGQIEINGAVTATYELAPK